MNRQFPLGQINPIKYFYFVAITTGLLFAFVTTGDDESFGLNLLIWQLQSIIPISLIIGSHSLLFGLRYFSGLNQWQQVVISGLVGSLLFAPLALGIDIYILSEGLPSKMWYELLDEASAVIPPVTIFWVLVNTPILMGLEYQKRSTTDNELGQHQRRQTKEANGTEPNEFMKAASISDLVSLQSLSAQLHYLEVVTHDTKQLILFSLNKATEMLPNSLGLRIHRSHWVAFDAIESVKKIGRQGEVTLLDGRTLPISRNRLQQVLTGHADYKNRS